MYISASSLNSQCKCEMAYHLSKSEAGKKVRADNGNSWALANGTILHNACQTYDVDRFVHGEVVDKSNQEIFDRYNKAYEEFFTDPRSIEKEKIKPEQTDLFMNKILPRLKSWLLETDIKKSAVMAAEIKTLQGELNWKFSKKKGLSDYYINFYEIFQTFVLKNPLDVYGKPLEFSIEKAYNIKYGDDFLTGYCDERRVYEIDGRKKVFLVEMKTSATEYKPEDCQVDSQMGTYAFLENIDSGTPLEDIYVIMYQLPTGVCTMSQRTDENVDFVLKHYAERLRRMKEVEQGLAMPLPICGTNSFDHSRLMCDYKDICPVWQQILSQPKPIVLNQQIKGK